MVLGYFIGVSFPSVSLSKVRFKDYNISCKNRYCLPFCLLHFVLFALYWQMNLPSSLMTSFDVAFNDDPHGSASRSFPENLGSGSTPSTPKVLHFLVIIRSKFSVILTISDDCFPASVSVLAVNTSE